MLRINLPHISNCTCYFKFKEESAILSFLIWQVGLVAIPPHPLICVFFYKFFYVNCLDKVFVILPKFYEFKRNTRLVTRSHQFTVEMPRCGRKFYANSFFPRISRLWTFWLHASHSTLICKILNTM